MLTKRTLSMLVLGLTLAAGNVFGQQFIRVKTKGVEVGTSKARVLGRIGKPLSTRKGGEYPCAERSVDMRYGGLLLELLESQLDREKGRLFVARMTITSRKWSVSGIRIGASPLAVRLKFGPARWQNEARNRFLVYAIGDGSANFFFRRGRLFKIVSQLNVC
ncbi:MAG: hypothetical protein IPN69_22100 [Acidobacteria bacterium]|nr:hypothetical protein [Acidobacteriota bacterium]MBK8813400.1 hypothetical protein [Acidobacteriota bacterium]